MIKRVKDEGVSDSVVLAGGEGMKGRCGRSLTVLPAKYLTNKTSFAGDIGNYYYGQGHPMKPHRIRMAHNLILNYGLYRKMEIYVSTNF